jgi:hypothetical protein
MGSSLGHGQIAVAVKTVEQVYRGPICVSFISGWYGFAQV